PPTDRQRVSNRPEAVARAHRRLIVTSSLGRDLPSDCGDVLPRHQRATNSVSIVIIWLILPIELRALTVWLKISCTRALTVRDHSDGKSKDGFLREGQLWIAELFSRTQLFGARRLRGPLMAFGGRLGRRPMI